MLFEMGSFHAASGPHFLEERVVFNICRVRAALAIAGWDGPVDPKFRETQRKTIRCEIRLRFWRLSSCSHEISGNCCDVTLQLACRSPQNSAKPTR
jgi:hypothetical protein